jgi:hypothetical protein
MASGADGGLVQHVERRLHRRGASTDQDQATSLRQRPRTVVVGISQKAGVLKRIGTDARMA